MVNLNPGVGNIASIQLPSKAQNNNIKPTTGESFKSYLEGVDKLQENSDASIQDLLSGKNQDINSVVAQVAKADMSFKLLVGVRNKIVEAYKQTMNMQI